MYKISESSHHSAFIPDCIKVVYSGFLCGELLIKFKIGHFLKSPSIQLIDRRKF